MQVGAIGAFFLPQEERRRDLTAQAIPCLALGEENELVESKVTDSTLCANDFPSQNGNALRSYPMDLSRNLGKSSELFGNELIIRALVRHAPVHQCSCAGMIKRDQFSSIPGVN